jgi:hypothetical protein
MDWVLIGAIFIAGWAMLTVLSCERLGKAQQIAVILAATEGAKAKENEIPIARASEGPIAGTIGSRQSRKAA